MTGAPFFGAPPCPPHQPPILGGVGLPKKIPAILGGPNDIAAIVAKWGVPNVKHGFAWGHESLPSSVWHGKHHLRIVVRDAAGVPHALHGTTEADRCLCDGVQCDCVSLADA